MSTVLSSAGQTRPHGYRRIQDDLLHVELKGTELLWAAHGSFHIPLVSITHAGIDRPPSN